MISISYQPVEVYSKVKTVDDYGAEKLGFNLLGIRRVSHFRNLEDYNGLNNGYGSFESEMIDFYSKEKFVIDEAIKRQNAFYVVEAISYREARNISYYHVIARLIRAN